MEQIYTIPVNEAFDAVIEKPECGCPICMLYKRLQEDELDIILGASMMEPDIRIRTNELGFCLTHYNMMLGRRRMLGMGLILESHLDEVEKKLDGPSISVNRRAAAKEALGKLEDSCYVCSRIEKNLSAMIATVCYLWESDLNFRRKFNKQPWFCLPHYRAMLDYSSKKMPKKVAPWVYMTVCSLHGFLYGTLYAPVQALMFGYNFGQTLAWISMGLYFDAIHGVSNFVLGLMIVPLVRAIKVADRTLK